MLRSQIVDLHRILFAGTPRAKMGGKLRTDDRQVGGDRFHKIGTPYHTPPTEEVRQVIDDIAQLCTTEKIPPLAQAALAQAMVVYGAPFERGNGKVANAVAQLALARRGVTQGVVAPLSLGLTLHYHDCIAAISEAIDGIAEEDPAKTGLWLRFFVRCSQETADAVLAFRQRADAAEEAWVEAGGLRNDNITGMLAATLRGTPVVTALTASELVGCSRQRASAAIEELVELGALVQITEGKRNRVFQSPAIVAAYAAIPDLG